MSLWTDRRGFGLAEAVVAALVILIVLSALALAARFFFRQSHSIEQRRSALIVARHVMQELLDSPGLPPTGDSSWVQPAADREFRVYRQVTTIDENSRMVNVRVTLGRGGAVDLTGRATDI